MTIHRSLAPLYLCSSSALLTVAVAAVRSEATSYLDDIYHYIENTAIFELNQEPGRSPDLPYPTRDAALGGDRASARYLSLNGSWRFLYAERPEMAPASFYQPDFDDSDWKSIKVPSNWEMEGFDDPLFRNIAQPFKSDPPRVPREYNPTGLYRRTFEVPDSWDGKAVFLRLEKVASASFVWINGHPVGYNEGAHEPAEYAVTSFLKPGENTIAVHVVKYADGVYLEDQDYWRLSGIFDDVWLYATPAVRVFDWQAITDFDARFEDATLTVRAWIRNDSDEPAERRSLRVSLLDRDRKHIREWTLAGIDVGPGETEEVELTEVIASPQKWTAEDPNLYRLAFELIDEENEVTESIAGRIGFKETEIRSQTFFLNGVPIKLHGVNSHMQHPTLGHAMDETTIRRDMEILKRFNFNCVRTSHYPPDKRYLELADEYGLYIIDETGDEAHATEFLSDDASWEPMYRERVRKMVLRDRNHPSILFWSAGNESGEGRNICAVIEEGRRHDPTRFWMYGGNAFSQPCEEIIGPRYPTPFELVTQVGLVPEMVDPRPSFMDEYLSVAGNAGGGMDEYWEVIRDYPRILGGAIWDFVSPGLLEEARRIPDASGNGIPAHLMGRARLVDGRNGKAIDLNGHDQWVEVYRDPRLDSSGDRLTLAAWVYPRNLNSSSGTFITKGSHQFGLRQVGEDALEFYLETDTSNRLSATLPHDWQNNWHHIAGVYDGNAMVLYIDGREVARQVAAGDIHDFPFPINVGRDVQAHGQDTDVYLCDALVDDVAVFSSAYPVDGIMRRDSEALAAADLWLDFEAERPDGAFYTYGIGARTYGCIWPDRSIQPEMWQFKKSAQPVTASWADSDTREIRIQNHYDFTDLSELELRWNLVEDGEKVEGGTFEVSVHPRSEAAIELPFDTERMKPERAYHLEIRALLKFDTIWAPTGHEVAWEQLELSTPAGSSELSQTNRTGALTVSRDADSLSISGDDFEYRFDIASGRLLSLTTGGKKLLKSGPKLNIWRAPLANETDTWAGWYVRANPIREGYDKSVAGEWYSRGLDQPQFTTESIDVERAPDSSVIVRVTEIVTIGVVPGNGFESEMTYAIGLDGSMKLHHRVVPHGNLPAWLPRVGTEWILHPSMNQIGWHGRGPEENYPDRKTGYRLGRYASTVEEMFEPYLIPQDNGLRTDTTSVALVDATGAGVRFESRKPFNFNTSPYTTENLTRALYPFQLEPADSIAFNLDYATTGVGCTARYVFNPYRALPDVYEFTTVMTPIQFD